jgi:hypothetical protein
VSFTSKVTWQIEINHLRCNPNFNNKPRYDYVLVSTPNGLIFAQILFTFTTGTNDRIDAWVLIRPLDAQVPPPSMRETDYQFLRIRSRARISSCFISAKSIIRGVVVIPTHSMEDDYYVFDLLDDDIFLRVRALLKERARLTAEGNDNEVSKSLHN